jgi:hypothetical protein
MSAVDDTLDTFFFTLDGDICLETLFKFLSSKLDDQPATNSEDTWAITHLNPITSAFSYVAKVAPRCDPQRTDEKLANDAAGILVKVSKDFFPLFILYTHPNTHYGYFLGL